MNDLRSALRQITKFPGYTTVVVLTLAFGIAVNTMIFGMVNTMFLQPLAVRDPGRLTVVVERSDAFNMPHGLSYLDFEDIRAGAKTLTDTFAFFFSPAHLSVPGKTPERGWVEAVSPDAFAKAGVTVALGRPLQAADGDRPPGHPVAVLSNRYWQAHFGGDPSVVGHTILINSQPFTIVGITQPGFDSFSWSLAVNVFVPSGTYPMWHNGSDAFFKYRAAKAWRVMGYRAPGASIDDVNAELAVFARRFAKDYPEEHRNSRFIAMPERRARPDPAISELTPALIVLFAGLCGLVLLIACANVTNLMGARALARERELVIRSALGASRSRLIRQLLFESLLLALLAGLVGYILASFGGDALNQTIPTGEMPIRSNPPVGWELYPFTVGISLLAGLLAGLFPALRSSRIDLVEGLKQAAHHTAGRPRHRLRNLLVVGQVAVACVVLVSATLFLRGLQAASSLDLGFRPDGLVMLSLDLSMQGYDEQRGQNFEQEALERVRALPGVASAAFSSHVPFDYNINIRGIWPEHPTGNVPDGHTTAAYATVTPGYLAMMGIPLRQGRSLNDHDRAGAKRVAVINEAMARAYWPGRDPIGQHFRLDWAGGDPIEVVGVTTTGKYVMLTEDPRPYFYLPQAQRYQMPATLVVRTRGQAAAVIHSLRQTVHALDPALPIYNITSVDEHLASSVFALMPLRTGAKVAAIQGLIALALAVMGLYAVVAYGVRSRTREIGLRIALGATRADVLRFVSREGVRLTVIGVVLGLAGSLLVALGLSRVLYGVQVFDPVAYPLVILVLGGIAALACWLPVRRAAEVDPNETLRVE